jgi:hypothetical protein
MTQYIYGRIFCRKNTPRLFAILSLFFLAVFCYPQQNISLRIIGEMTPACTGCR